ncbi:MAG: hypothetical protein EBZ45_05885 [Actinobacteria bacterium]|nr:hypothetical protein [Actinomycetota bacterium]
MVQVAFNDEARGELVARGGNAVVIIKWRDIPAQVNAQMGRERHQVVLSAKFQRAIDRAKRTAPDRSWRRKVK